MSAGREHAFLSASGAHRWLHCTASPHFEDGFPAETSPYAEEGTLAHSVCELYARREFEGISTRKFNSELKVLSAMEHFDDEMLRTAEIYVEYLRQIRDEYIAPPHAAFEVRVDLSDFIPEGFGRCDCVMVGDGRLHITDYKHGKGVPVSALENPQMRLYALGALKQYGAIYGDAIKEVITGICQPRISQNVSEERLTVDELLAWGESIKPIAEEAYNGPGSYVPGEHCRFCRGRAVCRARAAYYAGFADVMNWTPGAEIGKTYDAVAGGGGPALTDNDIGMLLGLAEGLTAWYNDLQNYATGKLLEGGTVPGYKLVEGRSLRSFRDLDTALDTLTSSGIDEALLYDRTPKSLSAIEKMLGKKKFQELLADQIVKPRGKPSLAKEDDKRAAYVPGAAEFSGI